MDQKEVINHPESTVFISETQTESFSFAGEVKIFLKVKTTGKDTDFVVRLTDIDENGVHLLIGEGVRRLKLRDSYSMASEVVPGDVYEIEISLVNQLAYTFVKGHKIALIITSSNFPRFAINPGTGANVFKDGDDFIKVKNSLIFDGFSRVEFPEIK